ncbi:MAG: HAD-IIIA family hydrolase [Chloroflexi bacterium]|nr:HAD-IIIA family hydrolase [Chloroflexota bacterium]
MENKTHPLKPHLYHSGVPDIDFQLLAEQGRKNILLDVDNTIALVGSNIIEPEILEHLKKNMGRGFIEKICLVSNTMVGKKRCNRVRKMAETLGSDYVCAGLFCPKPISKPFKSAMKKIDAQPSSCVMIGDQIFTDIFGAKRLGIFTILVKPLGSDSLASNIFPRRGLEKYLLKIFGLREN